MSGMDSVGTSSKPSVGESGGKAYLSDAVARVFLLLAARATAFASTAVTTTSL